MLYIRLETLLGKTSKSFVYEPQVEKCDEQCLLRTGGGGDNLATYLLTLLRWPCCGMESFRSQLKSGPIYFHVTSVSQGFRYAEKLTTGWRKR